ncbi:myeloid differentiation primary response protein MyD88 [Condylostylus longicornis]|uniref:myeloid differentiation primary response protein MyD88 n=1 Tax=Condylostylus longicornis TaxID=2530218 RepID=UPI00244DF850|nr:myeloid differentiation primary response protein MyD88 [Condylostylus longicornis]XP_055374443.1 myeloid differentiation primary response protein MyD88 [Condylostylus longicornis]
MSLSEDNLAGNGEIDDNIHFNKIPISALRQKARNILSLSLNRMKIIPSENKLLRDWRGVADLAGLRSVYGQSIQMHSDPMEKLLQIWCSKDNEETASVDNLIKFLVEIDRWDVLSDINEILVEDARYYKSNASKNMKAVKPLQSSDENVLTVDDVYNAQKNLGPQHYDAFVLFDNSDEDFVTELIKRMEDQGFKLCVKDRDLIGGVSFEHEAVMRLISDRCNRLIVIYSPEFLKSNANKYLVNYAQSLGIENGQRKILPCLYKYCDLPPTLRSMWHLDYNRSSKLFDFWAKLRDSIQETSTNLQSESNCINVSLISQSKENKMKLQTSQIINSDNAVDIDDLHDFVEINSSEIPKSYNEEIDIKAYTPLINDKNHTIANSSSKKTTRKWMNFKKWLPKKVQSSKESKNNDEFREKDKSKRKFKRQKLVSI